VSKLRGKHYTQESLRDSFLAMMDEMFPNDAPHHLKVLTNDEYNREAAKGGEKTLHLVENTVSQKQPPRKSPSEDEKCIQCKKEDRIMYQWCKGDDKDGK
jgi:hypothetical protein